MGFNPTFYAGSTKLSEVTIDSDLNMGGRNISSVDTIGANLIRAGRVDSPYMPQEWPTEVLDWGDVDENTEVRVATGYSVKSQTPAQVLTVYTAATGCKVGARITCSMSGQIPVGQSKLTVNGEVVRTTPGNIQKGESYTFEPVILNAGDVLAIVFGYYNTANTAIVDVDRIVTGYVVGPKTFNLAGKWLALGLDMKGLAATVKIQGVTMPYSDYAKYFPLAPTEITIPGGWSQSQERPVIRVYK